ncbi:MAG: hypothetical protein M3O74_09125 [Pseudomonadota bacterium]|nr:hypothetical protein [Pseudomonadota bacterium]
MKTSKDTAPVRPLFHCGRVQITFKAIAALEAANVNAVLLLARHINGDWGDIHKSERRHNERAVHTGARLISNYSIEPGKAIWIVTEADRSTTTLMLPEEL